MKNDIKLIIEKKSREMFNTHGYSKVSMRQIADACGISVGNLTYHYAKKEDLLMAEHDYIMNTFLQEIESHEEHLSGLQGYITAETAFIHWILKNEQVARLFNDVINIPGLRNRYCHAHQELYIRFMPEHNREMAWKGTVAMAGLEFEMADLHILSADFKDSMEKIFSTRFIFEGQGTPNMAELRSCIENGISISQRFSDIP